MEASGNGLASWILTWSLWFSTIDNLVRRLPSKEVSLMGIEIIGILIFARLMELSQFLRENALLLSVPSIFLLLWLTGIITLVRRWRKN